MREIKFRGRKPNGEWIYGDLVAVETTDGEPSKFNIRPYDVDLECPEDVDENTIGQFTGLLDGNGQEIFEGDIMRIPETEFNIEIIGVVKFDRGSYVIRSFFSGTHSSLAWAVRERQSGERRGVVIGNIYDNHELLNK